jgi:EAL domain-containing protein (putative c-di-GMP-specific phosphodiesterase class I)
MVSVAEQVDDPAEAEWLAGLGIDCLQGYLYGRPSPVPALPDEPKRETRRIAG